MGARRPAARRDAERVPRIRPLAVARAGASSERSVAFVGPARSHLITPERCDSLAAMTDLRETITYRWLAAGDAGDLDAFDELLLPDAVIHAPRGLSSESREAEKAVW